MRPQAPHAYHAAPPVVRYVQPARPSATSPALYVLLSFALMMMLAAATSVVGSVFTLALMDGVDDADDETSEVAPPAASLNGR